MSFMRSVMFTECCNKSFMLNDMMLSVIMLSVIMLSVMAPKFRLDCWWRIPSRFSIKLFPNFVASVVGPRLFKFLSLSNLNYFRKKHIMMNVMMLSIIMLSVIMLSVMAPKFRLDCWCRIPSRFSIKLSPNFVASVVGPRLVEFSSSSNLNYFRNSMLCWMSWCLVS